jgi:hypothetical protein
MSDHHHYEYASDRHDHRGQYAEDRHDHDADYAPLRHRHHGLEDDDEKAQRRITALQNEVDGLRRQLDDALDRIGDLEKQTPKARQLQLEAHLAAADLAESGYRPSDDALSPECWDRWHEQCPAGVRCDCYCHIEDEDQPGGAEPAGMTPDAIITQAEIIADDAVRRIVAEPGQPTHGLSGEPGHGPAAMRRFMREHPLGAPRQTSRVYWPDALCEFIDHDMCGKPAVARVTSRAEPGEHLWCCGPHRDHMLRVSPDDACVSWAKPGEPEPGPVAGHMAADVARYRPGGWPADQPPAIAGRVGDDEDQAGEREPEDYDPGPEVDDEGGMSEYRYVLPEDYERGQS